MRIAIYLSGHLRNLSETIHIYRKVFQAPTIEFDYYFTLWRTNHNTDNDSWNLYRNPHEAFYQITEADVYAICPEAKEVVLLDEFPLSPVYKNHKPSAVFQLYSLYKAFERLPPVYDRYVRLRTDLYFFKKIDWTQIVDTPYDLYIPETVWFNEPNYPTSNIFNDFFWISTYRKVHFGTLSEPTHNGRMYYGKIFCKIFWRTQTLYSSVSF